MRGFHLFLSTSSTALLILMAGFVGLGCDRNGAAVDEDEMYEEDTTIGNESILDDETADQDILHGDAVDLNENNEMLDDEPGMQ